MLLTTKNNYKKKQAENSFIICEKKNLVYDITAWNPVIGVRFIRFIQLVN